MKKNIFILAMVAMFVSANVMAQTAQPKKAETKKECCKGEKAECKGEKKAECKGEKKACCDKKAETKKK